MNDAVAHTFPASQALQLIALVKRWGISAEELLLPSGLREEELLRPHGRLPVETLKGLMERARQLTAEPGIGIYLGLQKQASMYGYPGFASMTAATVGQALELACRYTPAITNALSMQLTVEDDVASLIFEQHADMGNVKDVAAFSLLVGLQHMLRQATGVDREPLSVDVTFREPSYLARFAALLPRLRFGQPVMRVRFEASLLALPLLSSDQGALSLLREACERQLAELGFDMPLAERVRRLARGDEGFRSIDEVAHALRLSTRTLKRRLALSGVTFSALVESERRGQALSLLENTELPLEEIVQRLGYSTAPNFVRAFRRWTGETPAAYRKLHARR